MEHQIVALRVFGVVKRVIGCKGYGFIQIPFNCNGFEASDIFFKLSWFNGCLPIIEGDIVQFNLIYHWKKLEAREIVLLSKEDEVKVQISA